MDWKQMPYAELKAHHAEVSTLLEERRQEEIEALRTRAEHLGLSFDEVTATKPVPKYRNATTGQTWTGKGKRPKWVHDAIEDGKDLNEFAIM